MLVLAFFVPLKSLTTEASSSTVSTRKFCKKCAWASIEIRHRSQNGLGPKMASLMSRKLCLFLLFLGTPNPSLQSQHMNNLCCGLTNPCSYDYKIPSAITIWKLLKRQGFLFTGSGATQWGHRERDRENTQAWSSVFIGLNGGGLGCQRKMHNIRVVSLGFTQDLT